MAVRNGFVFRVDQIGSLLRPARLLDARDQFRSGKIDIGGLRQVEDDCVLEVLQRQKAARMVIFTDGEMRRDAWQTVFSQAVSGFEAAYPLREFKGPDGKTVQLQMHTKAITGKLKQERRLAKVDADFLRAHAPGPYKITQPSPAMIARASWRRGASDTAYPDRAGLLDDVVSIVSAEVRALADEGAAYLQFDEGFTIYGEEGGHEQLRAAGEDPEKSLLADIAAENACYDAARREGLTLAMHLCRGSRAGFARRTGSYEWLAERLFGELHVDRFLLEYDSDRVGSFEPLRHLPKGKVAVIGLVSSTNPQIETREALLARIEDAARYCPLDQLAISSQCGFQGSATRDGAHMTYDQQWKKLELLAKVAEEVWGGTTSA